MRAAASAPVGCQPVSTLALARDGARDMTPMVLGIVPFGLAVGATVGASSVDTWAGLASAPTILAGPPSSPRCRCSTPGAVRS